MHRPSMVGGLIIIGTHLMPLAADAAPKPPDQIKNICQIIDDHGSWYRHSRRAAKRYGTSIPLGFAIIAQESAFDAKAKPARKKFLGILPGKRPSSAKGYAQALDPTWKDYKESTGRGGARRASFRDSVDFVHWYMARAKRDGGVKNPKQMYLAYHQGIGGFKRGTYQGIGWLDRVADSVATRSENYREQLMRCKRKGRKYYGSI